MKPRLKACLVLGCHGLISEDGFCHCSSVSNIIIDLTLLEEEKYPEVLDFLDQACDLFTAPVYDYNKCVNSLSLLYKSYQAFDLNKLHHIQSFLKTHKVCGIWLMLILKENL